VKYSIGFRTSVLRKVLPPENKSVYQVAREMGISAITIRSWLSKLKEGTLEISTEGAEPTPGQRAAAEKFKLLLQGKFLPEEQRGEWLRQNGLHSEHLNLWEQELTQLMSDKQDDVKAEIKALKKRNRELEAELTRKEKALAEVVALLTLKKKLDARFGADEEA
jgi:transposase